MTFRSLLCSAILGVVVLTGSMTTVIAQGTGISLGISDHDSSTPVEITSEALELDQSSGAAIFTGNVIVAQGDLRMTCQRMRVEYGEGDDGSENQIKVIRMFGGVTFVSGSEAAESETAIYTLGDEMLVMSGNVLVTQGSTALSSDKLTYDLQSGNGRMDGNGQDRAATGPELMAKPTLTVTDGQAGLHIINLRKSYRKKTVIRDVSIDLGRGEVVALLGPNGSGKTTTFYSIAGLVSPEGGQVMIDGVDATYLPMYRRAKLGIGYLPQEVSIFRGLSVEDNIMAILEISVASKNRRRERLEELMSEFSISHLRRASALALSGGERRRVEIARRLAADPKYLLLDEPFAGVDPIAVGEIRGLVADLKNRGIGVLITDHNVRETLEIVDRAYILHDGKVLMSGTTEEVVQDENVRRVYLGQSFKIS